VVELKSALETEELGNARASDLGLSLVGRRLEEPDHVGAELDWLYKQTSLATSSPPSSSNCIHIRIGPGQLVVLILAIASVFAPVFALEEIAWLAVHR
jgi:hypothetical protein